MLRRLSASALPGLVRQRQYSVAQAAAATLPRGVDRVRLDLSPGDELHGFRVERVEELPQFEATAVELLHTHTGARWLHLAADDTNNVFNVAFRTAPKDSSGVSHILEHTVLCGSERYPVRDPFFNMLKRSLASFMNAMTASDHTMYPFATQNAEDYSNLLSVYLDAAFFPLLTEGDFRQEGHRQEFATRDDPTSPLELKGIVYNEMKGAMGSASSRFTRALTAELYPTSTYHHNSGGEPTAIPDLTWEGLRSFHAAHYHPSNARFFTYGDLPLAETLAHAQAAALSRFEPLPSATLEAAQVGDEARFEAPRRATITVPADPVVADPTKQHCVSVAWLLLNQAKEADPFEDFALAVASNLMLAGPQAAFYEPLIASGLGSGFAPGTGYGSDKKESSFAVGLKNVTAEAAAEVEATIDTTLRRLSRDGFPRAHVDSIVHQIELDDREVSPSFGIGVGISCMSSWLHGGDALRPLRTAEMATRLSARLDAEPDTFWQGLIQRHLLDNPHRVTLVATADDEYDAKLQRAEEAALEATKAKLSEEEVARCVAAALELQATQEAPQRVDALPTLRVASAVARALERWPSEHGTLGSVCAAPLQLDARATNGVCYAAAAFELGHVPARLLPFLEYFPGLLSSLGSAKYGFAEFAHEEKARTGGVGASYGFATDIGEAGGLGLSSATLTLSGSCLERNAGFLLELFHELSTPGSVRWHAAPERMAELIQRRAAALGGSLSSAGRSYAGRRAALTPAGLLSDELSGLPHVMHARALAAEVAAGGGRRDAALGQVADACAELSGLLFNHDALLRVRACGQQGGLDTALLPPLAAWADALPPTAAAALTQGGAAPEPSLLDTWRDATAGAARREFIGVPSQTNYVVRTVKTVPFTHAHAAPLVLLGQARSLGYMHFLRGPYLLWLYLLWRRCSASATCTRRSARRVGPTVVAPRPAHWVEPSPSRPTATRARWRPSLPSTRPRRGRRRRARSRPKTSRRRSSSASRGSMRLARPVRGAGAASPSRN